MIPNDVALRSLQKTENVMIREMTKLRSCWAKYETRESFFKKVADQTYESRSAETSRPGWLRYCMDSEVAGWALGRGKKSEKLLPWGEDGQNSEKIDYMCCW